MTNELEKSPTERKPPPGCHLDFQSRDHSILHMPFPIGGPLEPSSGVNASSRLGGRSDKWWGVGRGCPLPIIFCLVISIWHILANSEVLNLKYVVILGEIFQLTSPKPKYWRGCVPGIPGGVDASGTASLCLRLFSRYSAPTHVNEHTNEHTSERTNEHTHTHQQTRRIAIPAGGNK